MTASIKHSLAEVRVNGQVVGGSENMFRQYRWDVQPLLRAGENELRILFRSAVRYAIQRQRERPMLDVNDVIHGAPYLRKAPSHFGWDWGPKLPAIGVWRDIRLEGHSIARLEDVHLRQRHHGAQVTLMVWAAIDRWNPAPLRVHMSLTAPNGRVQTAEAPMESDGQAEILVEQPRLWQSSGTCSPIVSRRHASWVWTTICGDGSKWRVTTSTPRTSAALGSFRNGSRTGTIPPTRIATSHICLACFQVARLPPPRRLSCSRPRDAHLSCVATRAPAGRWPGR